MQRLIDQKNWDDGQWPEDDGAGDAAQAAVRPVLRGPSVGQELREAREALGTSVQDAATNLRIQASHLQALEDSDHEALPGATYAIGFLRSYADYLGLDADHVVARFKEEAAIRTQPTPLVFPQPIGEAQRPSGRLVLLSILAAACAYGAWLIYDNLDRSQVEEIPPPPERLSSLIDSTPPAASETAEPTGPANPDAVATSDDGAMVETSPVVTETDTVVADTSETNTTEAAAVEPASEPAAATAETNTAPAVADDGTSTVVAGGIGAAPSEPRQPEPTTAQADSASEPATDAEPAAPTQTPVPAQPQAETPPATAFAHVEPTRVEVAPREEPTPTVPASENTGDGEQVAAADATGVPGASDRSEPRSEPAQNQTSTASDVPPATEPQTNAESATDASPVTDTASGSASVESAESNAEDRSVAETLGDDTTTSMAATTTQTETAAAAPVSPPPPPAVSPLANATSAATGSVPGYRPQVYGAANGDARVVIRASADSWVQVQGAGNELLLTRILRAGDIYRAPNRGDLVLMAGNAGAIEVIVDGESLGALGPDGEVRRNVPLAIDTIRQQVYGTRRGQP